MVLVDFIQLVFFHAEHVMVFNSYFVQLRAIISSDTVVDGVYLDLRIVHAASIDSSDRCSTRIPSMIPLLKFSLNRLIHLVLDCLLQLILFARN